ncbi:MAG: SDR family oxidoreductase [bacterium]|nr:SDR family oxidoreductase [bacterium]
MKVLIAGGSGFIGSHLCDYFLGKGDEVVCVDSLITGSKKNIEHLKDNQKFKFIKHDISEPLDLEIDAVLHFASPASPVYYLKYPFDTLKAGSYATHNLLDLAKKNNALFLLASTSEVYGDPLEHPQNESYWGNVSSTGPRSVYDEAKRYAEAVTMAYHNYHGLKTRIVRIFNTYGERMMPDDGRAMPNFINQALKHQDITVYGDGSQTRSFCYVSDLVRGIYQLLISDESMPVNLGNPNEMTLKDLAFYIKDIVGSEGKFVYQDLPEDDPKLRCPNITRAQNILDWTPVVGIEAGLKKTIDYFKYL